MTESESLVNRICQKVFLSFWTMASPEGKDPRKELCDALVVFGNNIIIISVKDIVYKETEDLITGWQRWNKSAIEKSIKQLKGAKRFIESANQIKSMKNDVTFELPEKSLRKFFLVTISLGSKREVPIELPFEEDQFVHFLDEQNFELILSELDTASDFIEYLTKKEVFFQSKGRILIGNEENLLANYITNNRTFEERADFLILDDELWKSVRARDEYQDKLKANRVSYFWDQIIEEIIRLRDPYIESILGYVDPNNLNVEYALRVMAKENRFSRRVISHAFWDFHRNKNIESRVIQSLNGILYVFLKKPLKTDRRARQSELFARCFVARDRVAEDIVIVGIATEDDVSSGHSLDLVYFEKESWNDEDHAQAEAAIKELKIFQEPQFSIVHVDEYPVNGTT
jgi:hypothetical protein